MELAEDTVGISKVIDQLTIQPAAANDPRYLHRCDAQDLIRGPRGVMRSPRPPKRRAPSNQLAREAAEIVISVNRPPFKSIVSGLVCWFPVDGFGCSSGHSGPAVLTGGSHRD